MKRNRHTEEQVITILKAHERGVSVAELARQNGVTEQTIYRWKAKYGGMEVSEAKRLRELEAENARLKKLLAESALDNAALKEIVSGKVVTPEAKRRAVTHLVTGGWLSQRHACRLLGLPRSVARYQAMPRDDEPLRARLNALATCYPRYGYLLLHALLRQEGLVVNRKRIYRLYREAGLQVRTRRRKRLVRPRAPMPCPDRPNQRWSMDFVSDQLASGRRFRVLNIVDDFSRECVGQLVDTSISGRRLARFLDELAQQRSLPASIVCDNGPELTSKAMFFWARERKVTLAFIQPGKPTQNAFIESFNGKFRDGCLNQHWFLSLADARHEIDQWRAHYNYVRPHSSLGYMPPVAYAQRCA
ncbi:MAG: IS3 family transposase [Halomonas sp.]|nr:IS3 family transposase [Halomonas sp.]